jgi:hypothetical protein
MDFWVVHPIPLTVADVMAEFHVLDGLGRGQGDGSDGPSKLAFAPGDDQPRRDLKVSLKSDGPHDVCTILRAARSLDITTDLF